MKNLKLTTVPSIRMGEMSVASSGEPLRTLLGSCIGLALYDRRHKVGGLAHIVLPSTPDETDRPGKFVNTAIPALIAQIEQRVVSSLDLTAKMAGGASMFSTPSAGKIGQQNVESCEQKLRQVGIPLVASHCGGEQGRRMSFDTSNGKVVIEIVGHLPIEL